MPAKRKPPDGSPSKPKRTRPDVVARKQLAKATSCTVVKTTWNSFCKSEGKALALDSCLYEVNKAIAEAYMLANLHVLRMCERSLPIRELSQAFFYQCLSAVSCGERKKRTVKDELLAQSVQLYESWRPDGYSPPQSTELCSGDVISTVELSLNPCA